MKMLKLETKEVLSHVPRISDLMAHLGFFLLKLLEFFILAFLDGIILDKSFKFTKL